MLAQIALLPHAVALVSYARLLVRLTSDKVSEEDTSVLPERATICFCLG